MNCKCSTGDHIHTACSSCTAWIFGLRFSNYIMLERILVLVTQCVNDCSQNSVTAVTVPMHKSKQNF